MQENPVPASSPLAYLHLEVAWGAPFIMPNAPNGTELMGHGLKKVSFFSPGYHLKLESLLAAVFIHL